MAFWRRAATEPVLLDKIETETQNKFAENPLVSEAIEFLKAALASHDNEKIDKKLVGAATVLALYYYETKVDLVSNDKHLKGNADGRRQELERLCEEFLTALEKASEVSKPTTPRATQITLSATWKSLRRELKAQTLFVSKHLEGVPTSLSEFKLLKHVLLLEQFNKFITNKAQLSDSPNKCILCRGLSDHKIACSHTLCTNCHGYQKALACEKQIMQGMMYAGELINIHKCPACKR